MKGLHLAIKLLHTVQLDAQGNFLIPYRVGQGPAARTIQLTVQVSKENVERQNREPIPIPDSGDGYWLFRNRVLIVKNAEGITDEELLVHIKHRVLRAEGNWKRMQKQIEAFENLERTPPAKREKIAESVRLFVWQRDEGKCVKCGSQEKLEFDHIIPFADGGSNTERNIQLLCEQCNRQKGKSVSWRAIVMTKDGGGRESPSPLSHLEFAYWDRLRLFRFRFGMNLSLHRFHDLGLKVLLPAHLADPRRDILKDGDQVFTPPVIYRDSLLGHLSPAEVALRIPAYHFHSFRLRYPVVHLSGRLEGS